MGRLIIQFVLEFRRPSWSRRCLMRGDSQMTRNSLLVGAILTAVASLNGPLVANGNDYAFEPLRTEVKEGEVTLAVRLVHTPTGNVVPDATILQTRIDMEPDGVCEA